MEPLADLNGTAGGKVRICWREGALQESPSSTIVGAPTLAHETPLERIFTSVRWRTWMPRLGLLVILLLALALRLFNVNWDDSQHVHPDERWIAIVANDMAWPDSFRDALRHPHNTTINPLYNPVEGNIRKFAYGHLPLYLLMGSASALQGFSNEAESLGLPESWVRFMRQAPTYDGYPLVGRILSALLDLGTVLLLYFIGKRVYGHAAGLLAAALSTFTVTQIQLSHFYAFDPVATFFIVLAVYGAVRMVQEGRTRDALLTGLAAGCAISSKFSALPILAPAMVGAGVWYWRAHNARSQEGEPKEAAPLAHAVQLLVISLVGAFLAFAITSPFALLDWKAYKLSVIDEQGAMVRGIADFPYTRQYRGTTPFLYHIEEQVRWGMGWALGILGFVGLAWAVVRLLIGRAKAEEWAVLAWVVPYFGLTGLFMVKFIRYMLPIVPFLTLFGAGMLWMTYQWAQRRRTTPAEPVLPDGETIGLSEVEVAVEPAGGMGTPPPPWYESLKPRLAVAVPVVAGVTLLFTVLYALAFMTIYTRDHTWIQASYWMYDNIPDGSTILWEYWDDPLPKSLPISGGNWESHGYNVVGWGAIEEDTPQKFELLRANLRQADYIAFSSKRIYGAVARLPQRYPMTNRYYELLFDGQLGFDLAAEVTSYPELGPWQIDDHNSDESFTLYDHPRVLIFHKVRDLSDAEWNELLGGSWEGAMNWDTGAPSIFERISLPGLPASRPHPAVSPDTRNLGSKTLLLDQPVASLAARNDYRWNPLSHSTIGAILSWWLVLAVVGLIAWPLTFVVFGNLRDRGYLFARGLGLLVVAYFNWLLASLRLLTNSLSTLLLGLLLLLALSLYLAMRHRSEMRAFLRAQRRFILVSEAVFTGAFLFFVLIRLGNPDLWQPWNGGEKFMEFAFLNAILRSPHFPPYDPYFAGGYINYYYYGQYIVAALIKLTGIIPSVAFNLAIPTLFAMTFAGVFSVVYSLTPVRHAGRGEGGSGSQGAFWKKGLGWSLMGGIFVVLWGNLEGFVQVLRHLDQIGGSRFQSQLPLLGPLMGAIPGIADVIGGTRLPAYDFWGPSRVIPATINEFPYWSFLFADLHPHMIGIPFTVLFIALTLNMVLGYGGRWSGAGRLAGLLSFLMLPLVLGALAAINTWDLPTYLGLGVLAFLLRQYRGRGTIRPLPAILFIAAFGLLTYALYYPFFQHYAALGSSGIGRVRQPDDLGRWLNIWGFFVFVAFTFILIELWRPGARHGLVRWLRLVLSRWERLPRLLRLEQTLIRGSSDGYIMGKWALVGAVLLTVALFLLKQTVLAFLLLPLVAAVLLLLRRQSTVENLFTVVLVFTGLLVAAGVEVFFLKDFLQGGDHYRMNTLFKFFIQVWVLLGIAAAAALPRIVNWVQTWRPVWRNLWGAAFLGLVFASIVYPLLATAPRLNDRMPGERPAWGTLDGMAFMTVSVYNWPDGNTPIEMVYDYDAIQWLIEHDSGVPVVAEVAATSYQMDGRDVVPDYYRAGGQRVASMSGFPTFIGHHQGEQRYDFQTGPRQGIAREFFETVDVHRTREIIEEMGIHYIYIGQLERIILSDESLQKYDRMVGSGDLRLAYENEGTTIYEVVTRSPAS